MKVEERQREDLVKLGCEPKPMLVNILEELDPLDPLADKNFFPKVVSVKRCLKTCSFCGFPLFGILNEKECLPDPQGIAKLPVALSFNDGNEESTIIDIDEHRLCVCSHKTLQPPSVS